MQEFSLHAMSRPMNIRGETGDWQGSEEGQLALDIFETETEVFIISPMAGVHSDTIDVQVHNNDLLTIRGERQLPIKKKTEMATIHQECFWGKFSRTVVLPVHVRGDSAKAEYKNGVLLVRVPKYRPHASIPIEIVEE